MRPRHWKNWGEGGQVIFATTTALDFAHVFRKEPMRDAMVRSLLTDCLLSNAKLHAFVVMPHHIHLLLTLPPRVTSIRMMQRIKSNSATRLLPMLDDETKREFDQQRGLNRHQFWQRSFRGFVVESDETFWQKVQYIHVNPVKAGLCDRVDGYRWSSAAAFEATLWTEDSGLPVRSLLGEFGGLWR